MKKLMKVLSILLIVSLVFVVLQNTVLATGLEDLFNQVDETPTVENENPAQEVIPEVNNTTPTDNATPVNNTTPVDNNTVNNTVINTTSTNSNSNGTNETLPKTGVTEDYAIGAFAVICAVAAIFAFRKVKNYNIK